MERNYMGKVCLKYMQAVEASHALDYILAHLSESVSEIHAGSRSQPCVRLCISPFI
jgi:hypothetical protein